MSGEKKKNYFVWRGFPNPSRYGEAGQSLLALGVVAREGRRSVRSNLSRPSRIPGSPGRLSTWKPQIENVVGYHNLIA
jgi:hypothetical protein